MKRLYLCVTKDEYELPLYVADNVPELARWAGVERATVDSCLSSMRSGKLKHSRYREVYVDED